jgi:3-oxoadipate enol-lactonase
MLQADLAGMRLHYELNGANDLPVLMLSHSIGTNLHLWDRVAPAFTGRFRVLRYDTRGHGRSGAQSGPHSIADLGNDALRLLDALGVQHCCFCGLSLGGMIGMWLGIHAPHRVEKLVLANTAARIGTREGWMGRIREVEQNGLESIVDGALARSFTERFRRDEPQTVATVRQMILSTSGDGYTGCCAVIRNADLTPELHRIQAPVRVLAGKWDPATTPADGRLLAWEIRNSDFVELDAAHLSVIEDPQGFSEAVLDFLCRDEAR